MAAPPPPRAPTIEPPDNRRMKVRFIWERSCVRRSCHAEIGTFADGGGNRHLGRPETAKRGQARLLSPAADLKPFRPPETGQFPRIRRQLRRWRRKRLWAEREIVAECRPAASVPHLRGNTTKCIRRKSNGLQHPISAILRRARGFNAPSSNRLPVERSCTPPTASVQHQNPESPTEERCPAATAVRPLDRTDV